MALVLGLRFRLGLAFCKLTKECCRVFCFLSVIVDGFGACVLGFIVRFLVCLSR